MLFYKDVNLDSMYLAKSMVA